MARLTNLGSKRLTGILYVVATPIGNLADASARSVEVLRAAHVIACEDTRKTRTLLAHYGIAAKTVALHEHNEREAAQKLIDILREGKSVALVSDAGTPAFADPGAWLVAEAHRAGIPVSPVPGANAAAAAFSAAGFAAGRFLFAGFLPAKPADRKKALEALDMPWPVVIYEAPHRIEETLSDLAARFGAEREIVIAREITKKFEEVVRLPLGAARDWLLQRRERQQGEFVLVLAAGEERSTQSVDAERVLRVLLEALAPSEAAKLAARITGLPKSALYRKALDGSKGGGK
jgi:16S rRNA (cytidine1402-2'-O)-methyltransferase